MIGLANVVRVLRKQRDEAQFEIDRLHRTIQALPDRAGRGRRPGMPKRHMSKAARKRIADAQRARRARVQGRGGG